MRSIHLSPSWCAGSAPSPAFQATSPIRGGFLPFTAFHCLSLLFSALFCLFLKLPVFRQVAGVVEFIRRHVVAADAVAQT